MKKWRRKRVRINNRLRNERENRNNERDWKNGKDGCGNK